MKQVVIDNPVINSRFAELTRHYRFTKEGNTNEFVKARRTNQHFVSIPQPRKRGKQLAFNERTQEHVETGMRC